MCRDSVLSEEASVAVRRFRKVLASASTREMRFAGDGVRLVVMNPEREAGKFMVFGVGDPERIDFTLREDDGRFTVVQCTKPDFSAEEIGETVLRLAAADLDPYEGA